jgi:hypothetical protein
MDPALLETLQSLRDIEGVQGTFVLRAGDGQLLGRDLPAVIDDKILANIGPRIDRLLDLVDASPPTDSVALRFGDQRLDVKRVGMAELCVLAEATVSAPALRMAMRLVERKLASHPWSFRQVPPSASQATSRTVPFSNGRTSV